MACPTCSRRSALIAALAPVISRLAPLTRQDLLGLLALNEERLLHALKVQDPSQFSRQPQRSESTKGVPTAICRHDPGYPPALAQLDCAPAVLYATCTIERLQALLAAPTVALVGNLAQTSYAQQVAFALAHDLAATGVTIVSGFNDGLEGTAHHGAQHASGRSIAVMACTPDMPSSPGRDEHRHRGILERGAAVSEFPPEFHPPRRWCYIASQRIIAALASVVVVVQATECSSALLTTTIAAELGHDIAVVPGRVTDPSSHGTFALLRDGAHPVSCAQDVLELIHDTVGVS
jgi:DNA processing protein